MSDLQRGDIIEALEPIASKDPRQRWRVPAGMRGEVVSNRDDWNEPRVRWANELILESKRDFDMQQVAIVTHDREQMQIARKLTRRLL